MNLQKNTTVKKIIKAAQAVQGGDVVNIAGSWGSFGRALVGCIAENIRRDILYICPHIDDADNASDTLTGDARLVKIKIEYHVSSESD